MCIRDRNNARLELNTSCAISGTGFLLYRKLVEANGGWKHHLLTEEDVHKRQG